MPQQNEDIGLLDVLVDYVRQVLDADHVTFCEEGPGMGPITVLAASGSLTHPELQPGPPLDQQEFGYDGPDPFELGDSIAIWRKNNPATPGVTAFLERIGAAFDVTVRVFRQAGRMHVLELYYCNPDHPFGEAEQAEALRLAPLLAAGLSREELAHDLAVAEGQFRTLVEQLPAITYLVDPKGVGIYRSPQSTTLLGTPANNEWELLDWEQSLHPDDRDRVARAFADHMAHGVPFDVEYRYLRPDGEVVWIHDRSMLLYDDSGHLRGAQGVMFDITGRRRAEDALRDSERRREEVLAEMLRAEAEARAHIAAELHDDTIQVMTAAQLAVERGLFAVESGDPERMVEALIAARDTVRAAVERARRLTFELRPPLLEAQGLRAALVQLAEEVSREGGFVIELEVPAARYASSVEDLAYRTVQEALSNARKHAAPSQVEIAMQQDDGMLVGCVADDGCGFDVSRALDRRQMRLHMGLDAMRERVHLAGGAVEIASSPGAGSRIDFRIPLPG